METPSRYTNVKPQGVPLSSMRTLTAAPVTSTGQATRAAGGSQTTTSAETLNRQTMTPESLLALEKLIATLSAGGTSQQKAEIAKKRQIQQLIEGLLGQYTNQQAFADASRLMALNLQKVMERQMPAIERSIEGAGTSASSMQGILAQQMARDAALASGALGAQQAAQYAQATTGLTGQLAGLAREAMDPATQALLQALQVSKGAVESSTGTKSVSTPMDTSFFGRSSGGGGSSDTPIPVEERVSWAGPDSPAVISADPVAYLQKAMQQAKLSQSIYNI